MASTPLEMFALKCAIHIYIYFIIFVICRRAKEAGITVVNEVGVDPGIDHMLAMQCFDEVKVHGGKVYTVRSGC